MPVMIPCCDFSIQFVSLFHCEMNYHGNGICNNTYLYHGMTNTSPSDIGYNDGGVTDLVVVGNGVMHEAN